MPVQLGSQPEHGFDEPLGLLSDCHRRIERFLEMLKKVAEQGGADAINDEGRRAVDAASNISAPPRRGTPPTKRSLSFRCSAPAIHPTPARR